MNYGGGIGNENTRNNTNVNVETAYLLVNGKREISPQIHPIHRPEDKRNTKRKLRSAKTSVVYRTDHTSCDTNGIYRDHQREAKTTTFPRCITDVFGRPSRIKTRDSDAHGVTNENGGISHEKLNSIPTEMGRNLSGINQHPTNEVPKSIRGLIKNFGTF